LCVSFTTYNRRNSLESEFVVRFEDVGNALTNGLTYFYVDKWSDLATWGGISPPIE